MPMPPMSGFARCPPARWRWRACQVGLLLVAWLLIYLFIFLPRGQVG